MRIMGISGLPGSGKSLIADMASEKGDIIVSMGDIVREESEKRGEDSKTTAINLRKEHGQYIIAELTIAKIKEILSQIKLFWKRVEMLRTTNQAMLEVDYYLLESTELEKDNLYLTLSQIEKLEEKLLESKQIEQQLKKEKEELFKILDVIGMKKLETTKLTITKVDATTMTTIDSAKLKEEKPNVYAKYSKISNKKGYVKVTLKDKNKQNTVAIVKESKSDMLADLGL